MCFTSAFFLVHGFLVDETCSGLSPGTGTCCLAGSCGTSPCWPRGWQCWQHRTEHVTVLVGSANDPRKREMEGKMERNPTADLYQEVCLESPVCTEPLGTGSAAGCVSLPPRYLGSTWSSLPRQGCGCWHLSEPYCNDGLVPLHTC